MKLLSWMRTIKPNGDFCCLRAQVPTEVQDIRTDSFSFYGPSHDHHLNLPGLKEEFQFDEDCFCGFLAIGTLGTDPETPKFSAPVAEENVTGEKRAMAKLITEKLDKFLEDTSSSTRVDGESNVSPLQGHHDLFVELVKISNGSVKRKKGSLPSLFKKRDAAEGERSMEKKHGTRDLIKRIFEKLHVSTRNDDDDDSMPKKKDLRKKNVQIFRSKVHPVLSTPARDEGKIGDRRNCTNRCDPNVPCLTRRFLDSSSISEANRKRENWIKTDAEYLVLEL